jgi:hypothetical protein
MGAVQAITLTADGDFSFLDPVLDGTPYHVVGKQASYCGYLKEPLLIVVAVQSSPVTEDPFGQTCQIRNQSGTIEGASIDNVTISIESNPHAL